jgi:adenylosuccinate synthase
MRPGVKCYIGNGVVLSPAKLFEEMEGLEKAGVEVRSRLRISEACPLILPFHSALDVARETKREQGGTEKIGTTGRGIGPAYESKVGRYGVRVADLLNADVLKQKIELAAVYRKETFDVAQLLEMYLDFGRKLADRITNVTLLINEQMRAGKRVMFEGAQGTMLDVDHGTYPFVTSSSTCVGGICTGLGVAPKHIHKVIGVAKAYTTRVGSGPFPTELHDDIGEHLRTRGNEFGTVTGRPRRTGWLDLVILRMCAMLNGVDEIAVTKLDVLDDLDEIKVSVAYDDRGTPIYKTLKGWKKSIVGITSYDALPQQAKDYVKFIEDETGTKASIISTGPRREETIVR